ncbi:MAG TPA: ATP-binding protein [Candidatus Sulfotelmatobacter sp.]|nr:ATP-binding protein [Candidatus Sulfotelmatobacter sp.]
MSAAAEVLRICEKYEEEFPSLLHDAPYAFLLCRRDGTITATNPAIAQFLGATPNHRPGKRFPDLIPADKRAEAERFLRSLFDGERHGFQIDTETSQSDRHALRWTAWLVQGEAPAVLVMAEEIPEKLFAQQRLRQSQRLEAIGRLAGGVAHDFNNLLTGILLYCDLLVAGLESGHRAHRYAEEIRKAGLQATGIVRQLLAVARPTSSSPRPFCLNDVAEGMRNLLCRLIGDSFELHFDLDTQLGLVNMDPAQAQQVLMNLVLNARDAMPNGGHISIETRNCRVQVLPDAGTGNHSSGLPCALFAVSDNGEGMDESVRAHIFEPFFTTKADKGTGLGLATVHDIVTTSGGLIYVDSKVGQGTRVSVLLPLVTPSSNPENVGNNSHFM